MAVGFTQLVTHCDQYASSVPYFPFRKLLRPLAGITEAESAAEAGARLKPWVEAVMPDFAPWLPLLAAPFDAEVPATAESDEIGTSFRRERLFETVEQFLHRVLMMPTLLVVEDAHWMDDASRELLRHLVASAEPRPWLLTITRRPAQRRRFSTEGAAGIGSSSSRRCPAQMRPGSRSRPPATSRSRRSCSGKSRSVQAATRCSCASSSPRHVAASRPCPRPSRP